MKGTATILLLCFSVNFVFGQQRVPAGKDAIKTYDSGSYFITKGGERVKCYGLVGIGDPYEEFTYYSATQEYKRVKHEDIKYAVIKSFDGGIDVYLSLPFNESRVTLQRVVAYNDKYLMTEHVYNFYYVSIFDWDLKLVEEKKKQTRDNVDATLQKYFNNCPDLLQSMEKNDKWTATAFMGTTLIKCSGKDIFETLSIEK